MPLARPFRRVVAALGALLLIASIPAGLAAQEDPYRLVSRRVTDPGFQYHPSPADWRDTNLYQIFTDRFFDGDPSNNNARIMAAGTGWNGEPMQGKSWYNTTGSAEANARHLAHGGDWAGLRQKLPYLKAMGVKAVWISSVQRNEQGVDKRYTPYHAYHPSDLYRVEPMFGTFQELKDMIDALHDEGLYVILDVVPNHLADLLGLGDGKDNTFHANGGGDLRWWNDSIRHAPPFDNPAHFNNNGKILNYDDSWQALRGAFVGTDDLRTSDPWVQEELIKAFKHLIEATDCDGFRVDAIKHMEFDFIRRWAHEMRTHAASLGKSNFLIFGEYFSYDDEAHARFARNEGYSFNSVLWFSMMQTMREVFEFENGTAGLNRVASVSHFGEAATRLVTFLDNHDVDRISLRKGNTWADTLRPAIGYLYTATPIPTILYGTEHGFNQGGRENRGTDDGDYQREMMMDFGYQWGNAQGDKFTAPSEIKDLIGRLNAARERHPSLRRGSFRERWMSGSKGIFAFTRALGAEEALVILNTDWNEQSANPAVDAPDGTVFANAIDPGETATVQGGRLALRVPRKGIKVFVNNPASAGLAISNTRHWPLNGSIEADAGVWIDSETSPAGAAVAGDVIVSTDGGVTWTTYPFARNGSVDGRDAWHVQVGGFPARSNVQFAVNFRNGAGDTFWDSAGGANFRFSVNGGAPGPAASTSGTTTLLPQGQLLAGHDLVIRTRSTPLGQQVGGAVVYSADGGATWASRPLAADGVEGTSNRWKVNLGTFPAGTTVRFAVVTRDGLGNEAWDNNGGADFSVSFGARTVPVNSPRVGLRSQEGGMVLDLDGLETALAYTVESSGDLRAWSTEETFTAESLADAVVLGAAGGPIEAEASRFYRVRHNRLGAPVAVAFAVEPPSAPAATEAVVVTADTSPGGAVASANLVWSFQGGEWQTTPMTRGTSPAGVDRWSADLGVLGDGTLRYAVAFTPSDGGATVWANNDSRDYLVTIGNGGQGGGGTFGPLVPYSTNPTLGAAGTKVIDGSNTAGEWSNANLVAIGLAGDDPRSLGSNWTLHEAPVDMTHLWAAWDDTYLYLAYQLVDVTDVIDPANAGSAGGGKVNRNDGILLWIALDTKAGGATRDMWGKNNGQPLWTGELPDLQLYHNGNPWQAYVSRAVDGVFPVDDGGVNYFNLKTAVPGFAIATGDGFHGGSLWGVQDADQRGSSTSHVRFDTLGHAASRDSFYELRLPLTLLGVTRAQIEADGIGVKLGSTLGSLPHDPTTLDTNGVEAWNSPLEWGDADLHSTPFARVGAW